MSAEGWKYDGSTACSVCGRQPAICLSRISVDVIDVKAELEFVAVLAAAQEQHPSFRSPIYVEVPSCEQCYESVAKGAQEADLIHVGYFRDER